MNENKKRRRLTLRTQSAKLVDRRQKMADFSRAARWRSGYAEDCKANNSPAIPRQFSIASLCSGREAPRKDALGCKLGVVL